MSKSRGNSEGKEEDGHAKVTDGEVDDENSAGFRDNFLRYATNNRVVFPIRDSTPAVKERNIQSINQSIQN